MMRWSRYRKTLAAAVLGLVELAAYIAADPRDLPSWVVTGALAINALAVFYVRNTLPPQMAPTLFARRPVLGAEPPPRPRE